MEMGRYPEIAIRIRSARLKKKLSQQECARAVGCSRFHWIRLEQGLHQPTVYAAAIAEVLGVPREQLLEEEEDEEASLVDELARVVRRMKRREKQTRSTERSVA